MATIKEMPIKHLATGAMLIVGVVVMGKVLATVMTALNPVASEEVEVVNLVNPATTPTPLVNGPSTINQRIQDADQRMVVKGNQLTESVDKMLAELVLARAKKWIARASTEAPREKKSESEYLNDYLLLFINDLREETNNGAMNATPNDIQEPLRIIIEALAIESALTKSIKSGANTAVDVVDVLRAMSDLQIEIATLNNIQRFGKDEITRRPIDQRSDEFPAYGLDGSAKATDESIDEQTEEVKDNE